MSYQSLGEMFLFQAKRYGERVLYRFARDGRWESSSWKDALSQVREIALGLVSLGVKKGDRVAIFSANRVEWSFVDWANICIGALTVPIYSSDTSAQVSRVVGHSEATVLFVESLDRLRRLELHHPALQRLRNIILIDDAGKYDSFAPSSLAPLSLRELQALGRRYAETNGDVFERIALSLRPHDGLTIIYTSGTTGEPKGVLTTHRNYLFMIDATVSAISCTDQDVNLQFLPLAHSFGRLEHFLVVARGLTCGFARSLETVAKDLLAVRPTFLFSVPRIYENAYERIRSRAAMQGLVRRSLFRWAVSTGARVSRHRRRGETTPWTLRRAHALAHRSVFSKIQEAFGGRLRLAISGGAALAPEIGEFFHSVGILILEGYGLTECSTVSHVNRLERYKFGTVGFPLPGVECSVDKDGEVLLRGANIFQGYYRDPAGTREAIDGEGWLHTGDIGEIDGDGFLRITDRKKDLIVTSGGKKVAPQAVEKLLESDPWIHQAMVIGDGQKHLLAIVTLNRDQVVEWGRWEGLEFRCVEEMATHPRVLAVVKERIRQKNKELAAFEAVRSFRVLPQDFTVENEALTPTLKLRRQFVMERYKDLIDEMARRPRFDL